MRVELHSPVVSTVRVEQVRGMFDLPEAITSSTILNCPLPGENDPERDWSIGLICGPSGSGKSSLLKEGWGEPWTVPEPAKTGQSILDEFPRGMSIKVIIQWLSSVGFSSPAAWLRPRSALSCGQRWRAELALAAAWASVEKRVLVLDEFTSVIDRSAARIGSVAFARSIRERGLKLVAATCHDDITEWLQPDWVARPDLGTLQWRSLRPRPGIPMRFQRCSKVLWRRFACHHYLTGALHPGSLCFVLVDQDAGPVAFSAWLPFMGARVPTRREHRTVCLPDFQGIGLGNRLSSLCASLFRGMGYRAISTTTHPALIASRSRNSQWCMIRKPSICSLGRDKSQRIRHATARLTAGFEYVGEALPFGVCRMVMGNGNRFGYGYGYGKRQV